MHQYKPTISPRVSREGSLNHSIPESWTQSALLCRAPLKIIKSTWRIDIRKKNQAHHFWGERLWQLYISHNVLFGKIFHVQVMILMIIWAPLNVEKVSTKVPLSAISVPQNAQRISHYNRHIVELNLYSSSCKMLKSYWTCMPRVMFSVYQVIITFEWVKAEKYLILTL